MNMPRSMSVRLARSSRPPARCAWFSIPTPTTVDDQFALVYALLSPDKISWMRSTLRRTSMTAPLTRQTAWRRAEEIQRLLKLMKMSPADGSPSSAIWTAVCSTGGAAARNLVKRPAGSGDDPLYVVAIGAITNVTQPFSWSRIISASSWSGWGHALYWPPRVQLGAGCACGIVFDCGVLVQIPCMGVTTRTTIGTRGPRQRLQRLGDYLVDIVKGYRAISAGKVIGCCNHCVSDRTTWRD